MTQPDLSPPGKTLIMGVVNVTPDSFSDGGLYLDPNTALAHAEALVAAGADIIDLGAESSRPGARPVEEADEWARLEPVISGLRSAHPGLLLSVDTVKPGIMLRAAEAGCRMINDIRGGADDETLRALARIRGESQGMAYVAMHMHGEPQTMQARPVDAEEALPAVDAFFETAHRRLLEAGFGPGRIWLDPGIGFGKTDRANVQLMARVPVWAKRYNVAIGVSRKSLLGRVLGLPKPEERDPPSKTLELGLAIAGARMIRTHDVSGLKSLLHLTR